MDNYSIFIYLCLFEVLLNLFLYFNEIFVSKYYLKKKNLLQMYEKNEKIQLFLNFKKSIFSNFGNIYTFLFKIISHFLPPAMKLFQLNLNSYVKIFPILTQIELLLHEYEIVKVGDIFFDGKKERHKKAIFLSKKIFCFVSKMNNNKTKKKYPYNNIKEWIRDLLDWFKQRSNKHSYN